MKRGMKGGQTWIETVIYTLIALILIGLVLAFVKPKIEELQDKAIIEQSISVMKSIDSTILSMGAAGNQRVLEIAIRKGKLQIDGVNNLLYFEIDGKYAYSEPGAPTIYEGNIAIQTTDITGGKKVALTRDYAGLYDIQYNEADEVKTLPKSTSPYKLIISNRGGTPAVIN